MILLWCVSGQSEIFSFLQSASLQCPESPSYIICIRSTLTHVTTTVSPIVWFPGHCTNIYLCRRVVFTEVGQLWPRPPKEHTLQPTIREEKKEKSILVWCPGRGRKTTQSLLHPVPPTIRSEGVRPVKQRIRAQWNPSAVWISQGHARHKKKKKTAEKSWNNLPA